MKFLQNIQSAFVGHGDVQHDDIAWLAAKNAQRFDSVTRLRSDSDARIFRDDSLQPFANHGVIIDNTNFDHDSLGMEISIRVPRPGSEDSLKSPPNLEMRSFIPTIPRAFKSVAWFFVIPFPLSEIEMRTASPS